MVLRGVLPSLFTPTFHCAFMWVKCIVKLVMLYIMLPSVVFSHVPYHGSAALFCIFIALLCIKMFLKFHILIFWYIGYVIIFYVFNSHELFNDYITYQVHLPLAHHLVQKESLQ